MSDADPVARFLRLHRAAAVGPSPPRPEALPSDEEESVAENLTLTVERELDDWKPITPSEEPAKPGEYPVRFIDGSHIGQPVLCLRSPAGYPVPLLVAQVGAVALKLVGRSFVREFRAIERVLGFVADPFPWAEVEEFASALEMHSRLRLRILPARMAENKSPFDYEAMRGQAYNRCQNEMLKLEVLALAADPTVPTLVDGQLGGRIGEKAAEKRPLLVGVVKSPTPAPLHDRGWHTLLDLRAGQRTPYFQDVRTTDGRITDVPLACWYLRLAGGPRLAPNWGIVRVDVPWIHLERIESASRTGFVNRLSRWLVDARCRADSYARMPVSLEPIVRAEDALKPLFTPLPVLVNRLYRQAGLFPEDRSVIEIIEGAALTRPLGRVAAPPEHESTSGIFYFWVDRDKTVERTQIVTTRSKVAGRDVKFVGIVQEVYRRSRQKDVHEESARFDGRTSERPPFDSEGVTYAEAAILRTDPVAHTPPTEESEVFLANAEQAAHGYGLDRMGQRLDIGLLRNGGAEFAGRAAIDLDFLLGKNGGHLNVNGIAGLGTKSTLLLTLNWLLLREAQHQKTKGPSDIHRLQVVPVIFNVKNFDLFFIDRWNKEFRKKEADNRKDWKDSGVPDPVPFAKPRFFAPQEKGLTTAIRTGGRTTDVQPYSWSLSDIIEQGLFKFLFSADDISTANLGGLVGEVEEWLTSGTQDQAKLRVTDGAPQTFQEMIEWFKKVREDRTMFGDFQPGTKGSFLRRLKYVVMEGDGVLRRNDPKGNPLVIPGAGVEAPIVIDLFGITRTQSLQRFVVAAVFHQIMNHQTAKQLPGLKYLVTLDELNRFAPKDSSDPITEQIEMVAAEGRSQGVILLGAQQQASLVKPRVIENAAVRAIGRSGTLELGQEVWKFLGKSAKDAAVQLQPEEKLLYQPSFREPMLAKIPFPPFALSEGDAEPPTGSQAAASPRDDADLDAF